jgi:hypothetical protein
LVSNKKTHKQKAHKGGSVDCSVLVKMVCG